MAWSRPPRFRALVLVRGAGDLATGVAYRLVKAGFPVTMTEMARPLAVRLPVCFSSCIPNDTAIVEGVIARRVNLDRWTDAPAILAQGMIPVLVDPDGEAIRLLSPQVVIDGRIAKRNLDTRRDNARLVIGLGPGFTAGVDCHAVIETNRGHQMGRVFWKGSAQADTGSPAPIHGIEAERVLRAPCDGVLAQVLVAGCRVRKGDLLAYVEGLPVLAPLDGVLRGLLDNDTPVVTGMKIGDVDPRARRDHCFTISDKSLAVGGGVLEAILAAPQLQDVLG